MKNVNNFVFGNCKRPQVTDRISQPGIVPKGRFAPSPTGRMHLGNALAALLSYLSVKSRGGKWLLRIEDLDPGRSRPEYSRMLEEDLLWLGLEWDEGGMDRPDYCQSRRGDIYEHYFRQLKETGLVYPCWCTRADINASNAPHQSDGRVIYKGSCRPQRLGGTAPDEPAGLNPGRLPSWRVCVPDATVCVEDIHFGHVGVNLARECGDFVVRRSDGVAAYQLAVVVDDALMGVTEVVRGRDLLLSAPQQKWLSETLGFMAPDYAHIPLLCAMDGRRLCKRDRDADFSYLRTHFSPEEVLGMLAEMAGLLAEAEPVKASYLIPLFDWAKVPVEDIRIR